MGVSQSQLKELKNQVNAGFKISNYNFENGNHNFFLPSLERDWEITVPDSEDIQNYIRSEEFEKSRLIPKKFCFALLDIVGFSKHNDETQFKLLVRYQCEIRRALKGIICEKLISIGDGTIFVFPESEIPRIPEYLFSIDHAISGYNLDFSRETGVEISIRIGVHVGNAYVFNDINEEKNYVGTGINLAQRVSTFVPTKLDRRRNFKANSPIYVSENAYQEFRKYCSDEEYSFWDAGDKEDKHGNKIRCYAFHKITKL